MKQNDKKRWNQKLIMGIAICTIMMTMTACRGQSELTYQTMSEPTEKDILKSEQSWTSLNKEENADTKQDSNNSVENTKECYVYVCGEVLRPGVYVFPEGSRVFEAIEAADGYTESAAENHINQAEKIVDGMKLVVPSKDELKQMQVQAGLENSNLVDINQADKEKLMTLPGIGEGRALSIIAFREKNGAFQKPEDLLNVDGIKQGIFDKLKEFVIVS